MDEIEFWAVIDDARQSAEGDVDVVIGNLMELLDEMTDEDLIGFHHQMIRRYCECYRWDLRAAVVIILGDETTEESIDGFIAWLIAQGQVLFEQVLADADSLAAVTILPEDIQDTDLLALANREYQRRNKGQEIPDEADFSVPDEPAGQPLEESELPKRFPKLCERHEFEVDASRP